MSLDYYNEEPTNRRDIVAFRIHYVDGEVLEGNHAHEFLRAPDKEVAGVEFFYDEWDANGIPRREYLTNQESYEFPHLDHKLRGGKTPKRLLTKLNKGIDKPRSINPANKGDHHEMPILTMKGS